MNGCEDDEAGASQVDQSVPDELVAEVAEVVAEVVADTHTGQQSEMRFAMVDGKPMTQLPLDLYIPPDALEVILESFAGPLDLLLYLIKRQNLDILDISVFEITQQYMTYIEFIKELQFELAAEYLVMAAVLAEIKSRMLLPRRESDEEDEEDPRAELIRRLQEYERFKQAAEDLDDLKRMNRDFWVAVCEAPEQTGSKPLPEIDLQEMLLVLSQVLKRAENYTHHQIHLEPLSTRERMSMILSRLVRSDASSEKDHFIMFSELFTLEEGRAGVIVTFLAIMELIKESLLELVQAEPFAPIYVKAR